MRFSIISRLLAPAFVGGLTAAFALVAFTAQAQEKKANPPTTPTQMTNTTGKHTYETVVGDPLNVRIGTLSNGMKVYMSVNKNEPRLQTMIATRAGSKNDPATATGLAHYLEHMLFKGTSRIGTLNWEKEKVMLQHISDLYEKRRGVKDEAERKALYAQIDSTSNEAAKLVVANEYDKMMSSLGAKGTNAFTSLEQTVYVNDIPSNELEKWMTIESERLHELVLRLFHTELEAVYEEFNIGQDNDNRKAYATMMASLFPTHTYGTQTTIGTGEHLKNPSMVKIHEFFDTYYVPNNMAIILSGDFDPDAVMDMAERFFGKWQRKTVPEWKVVPQAPITAPVVKEVFGQEKSSLRIAYRCGGSDTRDGFMLDLISQIMANGQAGLIDLNVVQKQKALSADAGNDNCHDYSYFMLSGIPREGQTLEELRDLLLGEMANLRKGNFDDALLKAAIKNLKLSQIKGNEQNRNRASQMLDAFILQKPWTEYAGELEFLSKLTKKDIVAFAEKMFTDKNYVLVFKRQGEDKGVFKVDKPKITPVPLNRKDASEFQQAFFKLSSPALTPEFIDYHTRIESSKLTSGVGFDYIHNAENATFELNYVFDMGKNNDRLLPVAMKLLPYLGTDKYTGEQLQKEFFRLGLAFDVMCTEDRTYVTLTGLDESLAEGVKLFEHLLHNVKPDDEKLKNVVADVIKSRQDALQDKRQMLRALVTYGKYGAKSPLTDVVSEEELRKMKSETLVAKIKALSGFEHRVFYYGPTASAAANKIISKQHTAKNLHPVPAPTVYPELATNETKVFFANFPMVQAEVMMLSKGETFSVEQRVMGELYNDYFGSGLSSIMFQEIREAKALAYSTYARYTTPQFADRANYMQAYVGTQADKLREAVLSVRAIVDDMPVSPAQIESARSAVLKRIESERITKSGIYWSYLSAKRLGLDRDVRRDVYERVKTASQDELVAFQKQYVKGKPYSVMVLGDKTKVDMKFLESVGKVTTLTLKDIFGYDKP